MNNHDDRKWMNEADDILFRIRMLAGSGDNDAGADALRQFLELYNDVSAWDRLNPEDDGLQLTYILNSFEQAIEHIRGIPKGNRSRTADEAHAYRMRAA